MIQAEALEILKSGANVFLTGSAGSGKTFVLNKFIEDLRREKINVGITASTGIAATHLNGLTIHSWAGIGIKDRLSRAEVKEIAGVKRVVENIAGAKVLIIDEISMLSASVLEMVNEVCRLIKNSAKPFGGLQLVVCGDFFQLPPIVKDGEKQYAFESSIWQEADFKICYLEEQHRQDDADYLKILNEIRSNTPSAWAKERLNSRLNSSLVDFGKPIKFYSHNVDVDKLNNKELHKIIAKPKTYQMKKEGSFKLVEALVRGCLAPEELILKPGASVMFIRNKFSPSGSPIYVNGTLGKVVSFNGVNAPVIKTKNGLVEAEPAEWTIENRGEVLAKIKQLPLKLAWAITVHKSQGMSLDCAEMDLGHCFEPGMGYVALSRVKTLSGLSLLGINDQALKVDEKVLEFDKNLRGVYN